jgi:hypothetical protein
MNNPLKEDHPNYQDIPDSKIRSGFIKAEECASSTLQNFGIFLLKF